MYELVRNSDPIEDRYPLSPIQQSMLDESISTTAGGRVGLLQLVWDLPEPLDPAAFERAWERTVERHPILRTRLVWKGCPEPFQEVVRGVCLPFETRDWTGLSEEELEQRLHDLLVEDRQRGMSLDEAPLLRILVARLRPDHHCVVLTLHHTTFDGRTLLALVQEVFAFYDGLRGGLEPELPAPGLYRDYVEWLERQDRGSAEAFWRQALHGIREPTPLGIDAERARDARTGEGVWFYRDFSVWLDEEATSRLLGFARGLGLTLNTLLLGAWALLLSRYSGRRDVLFGVVRTHRGALEDGAAILGPVMSSVPFRGPITPSADLASWLKAVRAHWLAMREGDFASPAEIRGWSELNPRAPFFETLVLFETHELTQRLRQLGGEWKGRSFRFVRQPRVPLSIYGYQESRLALKVIFDPERFDASTMRRLLGHLQTALENMPTMVNRNVTELPLLSEAERHQLLVDWNDTAVAESSFAVHLRIAAQAQRVPQALAVAGPDGSRTYQELEEDTNRLAWLLRARGVGPGTLVAVLLERSVQEVEALLGVLKAGGTYLPLEGSAPERLGSILENAGPKVLLTRSDVRRPLQFPAERILDLDRSTEELCRQPASPCPAWTLPEQPAYVIYTSGSSGRPKGVAVSHRGLSNLVDWHLGAFDISEADRASRLAGLGFDASVWELWPYWSVGAAILLPPEEIRSDPEALRDWLVREEISLAFAPTPVAERLVELVWPPDSCLRLLLTGGDKLRSAPPPGLPFRLVNNYGPTENSVVATSGYIAPDRMGGDTQSPAIGRPIRNIRTYILDPDFQPVPIGASGELMIAGVGLAQRYLGCPELTAAGFVPDFARAGERLYRTGDLARYLPDGTIEFLGRRDSQIKLRGFRIEPGEIEAALNRHPAVQSCAVVAREGGKGSDKQLVAFLVDRPGHAAEDFDLPRFLHGKLPVYMIPTVYTWLEALPFNASGKVDRKALEARATAVSGNARGHVPPGTPLERFFAEVWEDVLGHDSVGIEDDFFALGGNSLHVVQVLAVLREVLKREIPADRIFMAPTISKLIAECFLDNADRNAAEMIAQRVLVAGT